MRCLLVHLTAVGVSISEHVAGELYYHHLHAETYTECRYVVRTGIFGGNNFSLYTSLSKSRADDNAILSGKHLSNILVVYLLRVDECQYGLPVVVCASLIQALTNALVCVLQVVFAYQSDMYLLLGIVASFKELAPWAQSWLLADRLTKLT